jgi:hypothetical protein
VIGTEEVSNLIVTTVEKKMKENLRLSIKQKIIFAIWNVLVNIQKIILS